MHTTEELTGEAFEYRVGSEAVAAGEVMPSIAVDDRLGIVMADPADGLRAGNFLLACVTAFYDRLRERDEEFFEYPDYYTVQATPDPADYLEFDVWPDHKNLSVPAEPEAILRAINDRAITVLLVPDGPTARPALADVTRRSAERRIESCYAYAPDGELADADGAFSIDVPRDPAGTWYRETVDLIGTGADRVEIDGTYVTQRFREIDLEAALARLPTGEGT